MTFPLMLLLDNFIVFLAELIFFLKLIQAFQGLENDESLLLAFAEPMQNLRTYEGNGVANLPDEVASQNWKYL